jgi:hypothetical protein
VAAAFKAAMFAVLLIKIDLSATAFHLGAMYPKEGVLARLVESLFPLALGLGKHVVNRSDRCGPGLSNRFSHEELHHLLDVGLDQLNAEHLAGVGSHADDEIRYVSTIDD